MIILLAMASVSDFLYKFSHNFYVITDTKKIIIEFYANHTDFLPYYYTKYLENILYAYLEQIDKDDHPTADIDRLYSFVKSQDNNFFGAYKRKYKNNGVHLM